MQNDDISFEDIKSDYYCDWCGKGVINVKDYVNCDGSIICVDCYEEYLDSFEID
jgi:formylmethanofuran dehydrogenase subunit E